jgi:hypothetical protein
MGGDSVDRGEDRAAKSKRAFAFRPNLFLNLMIFCAPPD